MVSGTGAGRILASLGRGDVVGQLSAIEGRVARTMLALAHYFGQEVEPGRAVIVRSLAERSCCHGRHCPRERDPRP